ncbi:MAG: hypothetical protein ACYDHN_01550 [Solirubrobacteraceae bacterium]
MQRDEQLTIKQTRTGYWSVQRGAVHVSGAMTRKGAEAERELLKRLSARRVRRTARPSRALSA